MKLFLRASILTIVFFLFSANSTPKVGWVADLQNKYDSKSEFIKYWKNSDAMMAYETVYRMPQEVIISKMWLETQGGLSGAGRRGAIFGIKGKGIKGYDNVDREKVQYQAYPELWMALSHFCQLLTNQDGMYYKRYRAWMSFDHTLEPWEAILLGMQVHPERSKSKLSYAACGCKDGTKKDCYETRRKHAMKCIKWVKDNKVDQ